MNLKYFSDPHDAENFEPFPIVFSRGSVAYEGNGASLGVNQPSFIEGTKGVYGLGVYESYTNLLTAQQSTGEGGIIFGSRVTQNTPRKGTVHTNGSSVIHTITNGSPNSPYTFQIRGIITTSQVKEINIDIESYENTTWKAIITKTIQSNNGITIIDEVVSGISHVNANTIHARIRLPTGEVGDTLEWIGGQLINKPYPLPWILGGTTRQPEQCSIPAREVKKFLKLDSGCIEGLIRVNSALKNASNRTILFTQKNDNLLEILRTSDNKWSLKTTDKDNNPTNTDLNDTTTQDNLIPFTAEYGKRGRIIINEVSSTLTDLSLLSDIGDLFIGGRSDSQHTNTNIRGLVFNLHRPLEEMIRRQKFAIANGYYPIDDKVTAFIDLESGLRGYRRI